MHYEFTVALAKRKCHYCPTEIGKGEKHFRLSQYKDIHAQFPSIKNICLQCAPKFYDDSWLKFLETLIHQAKQLKSLASPMITKKADKTIVYKCERCQEPAVKYSKDWQRYECEKCNTFYEYHDVEHMETV